MKVFLLVLAASFFASLPAFAQRETSDLMTGWKFIKQDADVGAATDGWQKIDLPHTWNNLDGQDGMKAEPDLKFGYYRGPGWYARALDASPAWKQKRVFLLFEAASTVAQVYLNGELLGEHRGGFTAFCFELTGKLRFEGPNDLRVRVDNSPFADVPPLVGDFDIMGGIYRPVHLIVTDPVCISLLDYASPGVYITTKDVSDAGAAVELKTLVSNGLSSPVVAQIRTSIADAENHGSFMDDSFTLGAGETKTLTKTFQVIAPHLWSGRRDPYLYHASVHVSAGTGQGDGLRQDFGIRTVAITNDQGFLLNGKPYLIHGVNCHQDRQDKGWAVSDADHREDMKLMLDMGVTAIRLAHYPQSECVHDLADQNGILLWNEIPLVDAVNDTPEFKANASRQLHEMILQRYNHPSAVFWGLFNEMDGRLDPVATPMLEELASEGKQLDPSRPTVAASCFFKMKFNAVADWICYNSYFGWYNGMPDGFAKHIADAYRDNGNRRIALSEYGAGANPFQHEEGPLSKPKPFGPFHPEEWQAFVHEQAWAQIKNNPELWGSFLWCMFDFASDQRDEGSRPGINDKGLVTANRKICKEAYYFYQANWTDTPMVDIAERRLIDRKNAVTEVKVYSNCAQVELKLNGASLGVMAPDDLHICRWKDVRLQPGNNDLEADAPGTSVNDNCRWVYSPDAP